MPRGTIEQLAPDVADHIRRYGSIGGSTGFGESWGAGFNDYRKPRSRKQEELQEAITRAVDEAPVQHTVVAEPSPPSPRWQRQTKAQAISAAVIQWGMSEDEVATRLGCHVNEVRRILLIHDND